MGTLTRLSFVASLLIGLSVTAHADVITDWNDKVVAVGVQARQAPFAHTRSVAIVHVAMFDAINSIERRYTPYRIQVSPAPGTLREVAAVAAAYFTLVRLYPDQAKDFESLYQTSLAAVPDGGPKANGMQLGEQVAVEILALRAQDGADASNTYRPYTTAGTYVPTVLPAGSSWGQVTPFALKEGAQFRPAAPVSLHSAQWAKDCDEVKKMGAKTGSGRTAEQTDIARSGVTTPQGLAKPPKPAMLARPYASSASSARAAFRSAVANPSVNHWYTSASNW